MQKEQQQFAHRQGNHNGHESNTPDFVGVERKQAGGADTHQQRKDRAQGKQKPVSRQDESAELEELRVHVIKLSETDPLGRAAVRW